jgi:hypothetical protein
MIDHTEQGGDHAHDARSGAQLEHPLPSQSALPEMPLQVPSQLIALLAIY